MSERDAPGMAVRTVPRSSLVVGFLTRAGGGESWPPCLSTRVAHVCVPWSGRRTRVGTACGRAAPSARVWLAHKRVCRRTRARAAVGGAAAPHPKIVAGPTRSTHNQGI